MASFDFFHIGKKTQFSRRSQTINQMCDLL
jgi:hypothetical protein